MKWFRVTFRDCSYLHIYGTLENISEKFESATSITSCGYNPESLNHHTQWCFMLTYPYELWSHLMQTIRYC